MFTVPELRAIVNNHRKTYAKQARVETNESKQRELETARDAFEQLDDWLAERVRPGEPRVPSAMLSGLEVPDGSEGFEAPPPYWNTDDLSDIPADLIAELGLGKSNPLERNLLSIIEDAGEALSVNAIVLGYWRKFKERLPREKVARKLYRMTTDRGHRLLTIPTGLRGRYGLAVWGNGGRSAH